VIVVGSCVWPGNRRLDEWVPSSRFESLDKYCLDAYNNGVQSAAGLDLASSGDRKVTRNQKRKHDAINHVQMVRLLSRSVPFCTDVMVRNCSLTHSLLPTKCVWFFDWIIQQWLDWFLYVSSAWQTEVACPKQDWKPGFLKKLFGFGILGVKPGFLKRHNLLGYGV